MPVLLSIIIVNYKTPGLVLDCLRTVYADEGASDFEVIVVDNYSQDDSEQLIADSFPHVVWIQMGYNSGFARANNVGIARSAAETVLLLNSDTLVLGNALSGSYRLFKESKYVACGVQLLNKDFSPQISGNFFMTGSLNNLLPVPYIGSLLQLLGNMLQVRKPHVPEATTLVEVDWINGAFLMVKKEAIKMAGLMDEDFFLYAEEAEWCYRLGKFGRLAVFGDQRVLHLQGETSNAAFNSSGKGYYNLYDKKGLQIMLSNFVRIRKQNGVLWFLFHLLVYTAAIPLYALLEPLRSVFAREPLLDSIKRIKFYSLNIIRLYRFLGPILSNRAFFYKVYA